MAGSVITKHVSSITKGEEDNNSSGKTMIKVKVEKEEDGLLVTRGIQKRKRRSRSRPVRDTPRTFAEYRGISCFEGQKNKQPRLMTRWNTERIKFAEQIIVELLKEKGASIEKPITRIQLRAIARKKIGDTGLLDHLLKHTDGNVTPGGVDRFRRGYDSDGNMQYWLESADLFKIKLESGIKDPKWIPPSWWKDHCESSAVSKLMWEEIEKMKSDIKELASKQNLPNHADATEKLSNDLMSWREQTDKQIVEISNSLTSTQCMMKELISWKDNVEQQLVGISNSLNNLQATGSNSLSPAPESWEQILQTADLDDFIEPWNVNASLIEVLPESVKPETYLLPPNPCKSSLQDDIWLEEQTLIKTEIQRTESVTRGESRNSNQEKAEMTPGSSMTPAPRSDLDDPIIHSQEETLKELVTWKAKAEQQLREISNAVVALKGQNQDNWLYQP